MDQRILTVLKEMARGRVCDEDSIYCLYCTGENIFWERRSDEVDVVAHLPDCPILLARVVLREQGMPLRLYNVTYDVPPEIIKRRPKNVPPQKTYTQKDIGYDEDEVRKRYQTYYQAGKEYHSQNVQVVYMRDV